MWCITGGEYMLAECVDILDGLGDVTVVLSAAGEEVAGMYGLLDRIREAAAEVVVEREQGSCAPLIMGLRSYGRVVVAPCTANTVAKIASGIADSLVSNVVSQALKVGVEVIVLPTDAVGEVKGKTAGGKDIEIRCRDVDIRNVERIRGEVRVVYSPGELADAL